MSEYVDEDEFFERAVKEFGDKFSNFGIVCSDESLVKFNEQHNCHLTSEDLINYKQAWLKESKCPNCGTDLGGLFGTFVWGIIHGEGFCSECKKTSIFKEVQKKEH